MSARLGYHNIDEVLADEINLATRCALGNEVVSPSQQCWVDPGENFNVQVKLELADKLFDFLVGETVDVLNEVQECQS